jgi:hypothetical protein
MREIMLLLLGLTAWAATATGQAAPRGPVASVVLRDVARGPLSVDRSAVPRDSVVRDVGPTYWIEGALMGALVGAVGGLLLGAAVCEDGGGCSTAGILGGALLLTIPGALVGGQFRKGGDENDSP